MSFLRVQLRERGGRCLLSRSDGEGLVVEEDEVRMAHMLLKHGVEGKEAETVKARTLWKRKGFLSSEEKEMANIIKHAWRKKQLEKEKEMTLVDAKKMDDGGGDGGDYVASLSR